MATIKHEISLGTAIALTTHYRDTRPADFPLYESFDVSAVRQLVENVDCRYLRVYFGRKEDNEVVMVLVAADEQEQDILPPDQESEETTDIILIEDGYRCPRYCPSNSVLATGV